MLGLQEEARRVPYLDTIAVIIVVFGLTYLSNEGLKGSDFFRVGGAPVRARKLIRAIPLASPDALLTKNASRWSK